MISKLMTQILRPRFAEADSRCDADSGRGGGGGDVFFCARWDRSRWGMSVAPWFRVCSPGACSVGAIRTGYADTTQPGALHGGGFARLGIRFLSHLECVVTEERGRCRDVTRDHGARGGVSLRRPSPAPRTPTPGLSAAAYSYSGDGARCRSGTRLRGQRLRRQRRLLTLALRLLPRSLSATRGQGPQGQPQLGRGNGQHRCRRLPCAPGWSAGGAGFGETAPGIAGEASRTRLSRSTRRGTQARHQTWWRLRT